MSFITIAFIIYVDGGINGFSLWNSMPIVIALITLLVDKSMVGLKYAIYAFAYTINITVFIVHISYLVDIGTVLSLPLLSGQTIYGLPIYSIGAGYIVGMIAVVIEAVHDNNKEKQPNKSL